MELSEKTRSNLILFVLFIAWVVGYIDKTAINVASIKITSELGLTPSQVGLVMSSFFFSYALMTLFGGILADKYGAKRVLTIVMVMWSLFTILTGAAWSFTSLVVIRFFFGISQGGFPSATSVAIAEIFPKELRGRAKSFQVSAGSMGTAVGTFVCAALTMAFGWRSSFYIFGVIGVIIVILFYTLYKDKCGAGYREEKQAARKVPITHALKEPMVWKLAVVQFGLGTFMWGLNSWLPAYWVNVRHLDMVTMGALSMIPWLISFCFMNFNGWFLDKYMAGKEKIVLCVALALAAVFMYLMIIASNVTMAFAYLTVTTVTASITSSTVFVLPLKYMKTDIIGTSTGIITFGQQLAGVIAPAVMGYLITLFNGSYDAVFGFVIATLVASFIAAAAISTKEKEEKSNAVAG